MGENACCVPHIVGTHKVMTSHVVIYILHCQQPMLGCYLSVQNLL